MEIEIRFERLETIVRILKKNIYPSKGYILREIENRIYAKYGNVTDRAGLSDSTFERDKKEVKELFNYVVKYSMREKGYYIDLTKANPDSEDRFNRFSEFVHKNQTITTTSTIQLEKINIQGLENLNGALHCIQQKQYIQFNYENYNKETVDFHKIAPGLIKEFKRRVYVIGLDCESGITMSFSFERISDFKILDEKYSKTPITASYLLDCYGIVDYADYQAQDTLLKAYGSKAKYIGSHKLHHSQEIHKVEADCTIFKLKLKPTYDFIIELMSHSHQLEVLEPEYLRNEIKWRLEDTLKFYK
jgi:hypothetical protein